MGFSINIITMQRSRSQSNMLGIILMVLLLASSHTGYAWPVIEHIEWHAVAKQASLTIHLPENSQVKPVIVTNKNTVTVHLDKVTLAAIWQNKMDLTTTKSFALSMQGVDSKQGCEFIIVFKQPVKASHTIAGHQLILHFQPDIDHQKSLISLNLQNVPVRQLLQQVAKMATQDVIVDDTVKGNISIHLTKTTWQQALRLILQSQGLIRQEIDGVWYIAPAAQIAEQDKAMQLAASVAPLNVTMMPLHFAKASDVVTMLTQQHSHLLSSRSSVMMNERTNTLIIRATAVEIEQIRHMVAALDKVVPQVRITAEIVVLDETGLRELGVLFRNTDKSSNAVGSVTAARVNLPISHPAGIFGVNLGKIGGTMLNLELQALQSQGHGKIIASPELTVTDNHEASIAQGDDIPFQTSTSSGATQVEFKSATLSLTVTPQITPGNQILLTLKVTKDSVTKQTGTAGNIPIIATSEINTHILIKNGETISLGGIKINERRRDESSVPYLSDIPLLGFLFRNQSLSRKQMDLLVFLTSRIVDQP